MMNKISNKKKILNDPVYGFISLPDALIFDLIEHPWFQRLRRIKQLGLTHLVYPGALHTRFHHAIGAMHLMQQSIDVLRSKGHLITSEEGIGALTAILLHDIGHSPYSHTLEKMIVHNMPHEELTLLFMKELKNTFGDPVRLAIGIYTNTYPKKFLHQLVSSQLDTDRLDYLKRDSFFTGVSEGVINSDRIIKMFDVVDDNLVVEAKGIYSIEKFIVARRLMYWQVYLHKTVIAAEQMLMQIIRRAKFLSLNGQDLFATRPFKTFLKQNIGKNEIIKDLSLLGMFGKLDDFDLLTSIKAWTECNDKVLSLLCNNLINRRLFRTEIRNRPIKAEEHEHLRKKVCKHYSIDSNDADYFVFAGTAQNNAYDPKHEKISILFRDGELHDITKVSDHLTIAMLTKTVKKYFICYPKNLDEETLLFI
jgi:uncharacterized protein